MDDRSRSSWAGYAPGVDPRIYTGSLPQLSRQSHFPPFGSDKYQGYIGGGPRDLHQEPPPAAPISGSVSGSDSSSAGYQPSVLAPVQQVTIPPGFHSRQATVSTLSSGQPLDPRGLPELGRAWSDGTAGDAGIGAAPSGTWADAVTVSREASFFAPAPSSRDPPSQHLGGSRGVHHVRPMVGGDGPGAVLAVAIPP